MAKVVSAYPVVGTNSKLNAARAVARRAAGGCATPDIRRRSSESDWRCYIGAIETLASADFALKVEYYFSQKTLDGCAFTKKKATKTTQGRLLPRELTRAGRRRE